MAEVIVHRPDQTIVLRLRDELSQLRQRVTHLPNWQAIKTPQNP
jgi:hypothetical protein